jgi:hypothetical protein
VNIFLNIYWNVKLHCRFYPATCNTLPTYFAARKPSLLLACDSSQGFVISGVQRAHQFLSALFLWSGLRVALHLQIFGKATFDGIYGERASRKMWLASLAARRKPHGRSNLSGNPIRSRTVKRHATLVVNEGENLLSTSPPPAVEGAS